MVDAKIAECSMGELGCVAQTPSFGVAMNNDEQCVW